MKDMAELVDEFSDKNNIHSFEGITGLKNIEKIIKAIGYGNHGLHGLRYGSPIECFLEDNPAACEAIVDFIATSNVPEWRESLGFECHCEEIEEGDEEDEGEFTTLD